MKRLLVACALLTSTLAFSQSMIVKKTGKILTIDEQGAIYDLGHFLLPYQIKHMGGRYLVDEDRKLRTIDKNGMMFDKTEEDRVPRNIEYFGENYFISKLGKIYTIDDQGFMYEGEKEKEFRNVIYKGGNFVIAEKKVEGEKVRAIYVITNQGQILEVNVPGLRLDRINFVGGQYFTTSQGELFTVSADGFIYSKKSLGHFNGWELRKGGNYFVVNKNLYTVSSSGILTNAATSNDFATIRHFGTNFFITASGQVFTVSSTGAVRSVYVDLKLSDISQFSRL